MITVHTHLELPFEIPTGTEFQMHDDGDLTVRDGEGLMVAGFARGLWTAAIHTEGTDQ